MKNLSYTGKDLNTIFTSITSSLIFWELKRSQIKNYESNVNHIIFSGILTNKSIGIAISKKINHIILVNRLHDDNSLSISDDGIELLYKNDIFLIALGTRWIYNTKFGKKMVNVIICNMNASLWNSTLTVDHVFIGLEEPLPLSYIFARLRNSILYLPAKHDPNDSVITNILLITKEFDKSEITDVPEVIITLELTSSIIRWCYTKGIFLVFINADVLYSEVARDLSYFVSKTTNIQTTFLSHLNYKIKLK